MIIAPVVAPPRSPFKIPDGNVPLTGVLRKVVGPRTVEFLLHPARVGHTLDVETYS